MPRINLGNNEVGLCPGGGGYPTKFYTGKLRPEVHPSPLDRLDLWHAKGTIPVSSEAKHPRMGHYRELRG